MKRRILDWDYGAAELAADDPLVAEAEAAGWRTYAESFNDDKSTCRRIDGADEFSLSGSRTQYMVCVYDETKWLIV